MAVSNIATYSLAEFAKAAGLNADAVRAARRRGLRVLTIGRSRFVRGADWEQFLLSQQPQQEKAGASRD